MFYQFRKTMKELGYRGWRLEGEKKSLFLSKFDDRFNDDEYRFYITTTDGVLSISKSSKIKNYKKSVGVHANNPYFLEAKKVVEKLNEENFLKEPAM